MNATSARDDRLLRVATDRVNVFVRFTARLYGVSAGDPRAFISAIASLAAVAAVATLVPAWRASRLDPAETLRSE